jgi:hypothetical protein
VQSPLSEQPPTLTGWERAEQQLLRVFAIMMESCMLQFHEMCASSTFLASQHVAAPPSARFGDDEGAPRVGFIRFGSLIQAAAAEDSDPCSTSLPARGQTTHRRSRIPCRVSLKGKRGLPRLLACSRASRCSSWVLLESHLPSSPSPLVTRLRRAKFVRFEQPYLTASAKGHGPRLTVLCQLAGRSPRREWGTAL